jgi:hypothetical protein
MAGFESSFQPDSPCAPTLGALADHRWLFVLSQLSSNSTHAISSKMAALEGILVADLMEMSAEELRSRGWALKTVEQ